MTPDDVRAAAQQLVDFHERFALLFGKEQAGAQESQWPSFEEVAQALVFGDIAPAMEAVCMAWRPRKRQTGHRSLVQ